MEFLNQPWETMQVEEFMVETNQKPERHLNDVEEEAIANFVVGCAQVGFGIREV